MVQQEGTDDGADTESNHDDAGDPDNGREGGLKWNDLKVEVKDRQLHKGIRNDPNNFFDDQKLCSRVSFGFSSSSTDGNSANFA